jgi:hypothetical protein
MCCASIAANEICGGFVLPERRVQLPCKGSIIRVACGNDNATKIYLYFKSPRHKVVRDDKEIDADGKAA